MLANMHDLPRFRNFRLSYSDGKKPLVNETRLRATAIPHDAPETLRPDSDFLQSMHTEQPNPLKVARIHDHDIGNQCSTPYACSPKRIAHQCPNHIGAYLDSGPMP